MKYIELSYPVDVNDGVQLLPSIDAPRIISRSRISDGAGSNTSYISIYAHHGTHIDAPWHFNDAGRKIAEFGISDYIFSRVLFLEIPRVNYQPITSNELKVCRKDLDQCDALLVFTGFSSFRKSSPNFYFEETPGFSEEAAEYISSFKNIKCIGFDFISVENISRNRPANYPVHRILLRRQPPLILIEDMNLAGIVGEEVKKLFVIPIRMQGLEASPATIFAEVEG